MERKPVRKSESSRRADRIIQQRTLWFTALLGVIVFIAVIARLFTLQVVQHEELEEKALRQQTRSVEVSASRGTIYDKNGNILAISWPCSPAAVRSCHKSWFCHLRRRHVALRAAAYRR